MLVTEITAQSIDAALRKQLDALNTSVESRETGSVIQVGAASIRRATYTLPSVDRAENPST